MKSTVSFMTLGCKTNQFESAAMSEQLIQAGYELVDFEDGAQLVIVNTCTVTSATDFPITKSYPPGRGALILQLISLLLAVTHRWIPRR